MMGFTHAIRELQPQKPSGRRGNMLKLALVLEITHLQISDTITGEETKKIGRLPGMHYLRQSANDTGRVSVFFNRSRIEKQHKQAAT